MPEVYAEPESAADLAADARTTGARLRWERMGRPAGDVPAARPAVEPEVGPDAVRLAEELGLS